MKTTNDTLLHILAISLVMGLGLPAGKASAAIQTINSWSNDGGGYTANFESNVKDSFEDSIHFSLPKVGSFNFVDLKHDNNIFFQEVDVWGDGKLLGSVKDDSDSRLNFLGDSNVQNYELRIRGYGYSGEGSYHGNIVINQVPEPQTFAMLLVGLGLVGFSARRRKTDNVD